MKFLKRFWPVIFVFLFSLVSIIPFFHPGFFPFHDNTQVQRVFEMTKSLKDGLFPVRWVSDLGFGYGYPLFNFYAPLAYYLGSLINILGVDVLTSTKLMMVLGVIASGLSMYFLAKEFWGKYGGIISALLYVFAPYHALDIYVRGDVSEFWAYAIIPLVFYALLKVYKTQEYKFVVIGALSYAALIITHNLTAFMTTPFVLVFLAILFWQNKKTGKSLLATLLLGLIISAFYWIPAFLEISYTNVLSQVGGGADYKDHFVCLSQIWSSPWAFGGSIKGCVDGLSFMLGKIHILLFILGIIVFGFVWKLKKSDIEKKIFFGFSTLSLLIVLFLTLGDSKLIWDFVQPMAIFQYPWRFLLLSSFFISLICGSIAYYWQNVFSNKLSAIVLMIILSLLVVWFNSKYFVPQNYLSVSAVNYVNNYFLKFTTSQISSEYMPKNFQKPKFYIETANKIAIKQGGVEILTQSIKTGMFAFKYSADVNSEVIIPIAYFPGWQGYLDGENISIAEDKKGTLVNLPFGRHQFKLIFSQTLLEKYANLTSLAGIMTLVVGIIYRIKRKYA